jgi:hypothetical protein
VEKGSEDAAPERLDGIDVDVRRKVEGQRSLAKTGAAKDARSTKKTAKRALFL